MVMMMGGRQERTTQGSKDKRVPQRADSDNYGEEVERTAYSFVMVQKRVHITKMVMVMAETERKCGG